MMRTYQRAVSEGANKFLDASELQTLRKKVNSQAYLTAAIHRIALIMSNELLDIPQGGLYERQRQRK
jgi:hypothetical protein